MRKQRNTLLAGIAALALIAGAGAASAQQTGSEAHGAKQPNAASQQMNKGGGTMGENTGARHGTAGKMNQNAAEENRAGGKMDQNAAEENKAGEKMGRNAAEENKTGGKMGQNATEETRGKGKMGHTAQQQNRGKMTQRSAQYDRTKQQTTGGREGNKRQTTAQERDRFGNQNAAQRNEPNAQTTAAQERNGLRGLQGNAGVNLQLNDEQRTRIRETVIDARGAPRIAHVDFNVAVGTAIPRTGVRIVPVTPALVQIDPSWRGYRYFIYEEELVLVDPATMTIVAVITV